MPKQVQERPLRLLSLVVQCSDKFLDGGGVKGLSSLLILDRIFRTMQEEGGYQEMPKPCDYFDVICGTSTGGLIAIMLGRLEMTIEDTIEAFESFAGTVFAERLDNKAKVLRLLNAFSGRKAWFRGEDLENCVKELIGRQGLDPDAPLRPVSETSRCKVFVTAVRTKPVRLELLRSYKTTSHTEHDYKCTIWQAARATSAANLFFEPIKLGRGEFFDGSWTAINPINELMAEVSRIYEEPRFGCILSLGTGQLGIKYLNPRAKIPDLAKSCKDLLLNANRIAQDFVVEGTLGWKLTKAEKYFRLDLDVGAEDIGLEKWKKMGDLEGFVFEYLKKIEQANKVLACSKSLLNPTPYAATTNYSAPKHSMIPEDVNANFTGREYVFSRINLLFAESEANNQRVLLWGLGGIGKTQIALRYSERALSDRSVFWLQADTEATLRESALKAISLLSGPTGSNDGDAGNTTGISRSVKDLPALLKALGYPWLLVIDNADDIDMFKKQGSEGAFSLSEIMPRSQFGRILMTSRDARIAGLDNGSVVPAKNGINVEAMTPEEARITFQKSIPENLYAELGMDTGTTDLEIVLKLFDGLPLAVSQAAAYIRETRTPIMEYLKEFRTAIATGTDPFYREDSQKASVFTTWNISYRKLNGNGSAELDTGEKSQPRKSAAAKLLDLTTMFEHNGIPEGTLRGAWMTTCSTHTAADKSFRQAAGLLLNFSIISRNPKDNTYSLHPLVHEWTMRQLMEEEKRKYLNCIISEYWRSFSFEGTTLDGISLLTGKNVLPAKWDFSLALRLFPHCVRAVDLAVDLGPSFQHLGTVCLSLSSLYLYAFRRPKTSAKYAEQSFRLSDHDDISLIERSERQLVLSEAYLKSDNNEELISHCRDVITRHMEDREDRAVWLNYSCSRLLSHALCKLERVEDAITTLVEELSGLEAQVEKGADAISGTSMGRELAFITQVSLVKVLHYCSGDDEKQVYSQRLAKELLQECTVHQNVKIESSNDVEYLARNPRYYADLRAVIIADTSNDLKEWAALYKENLDRQITSTRLGIKDIGTLQCCMVVLELLPGLATQDGSRLAAAETICEEFLDEMPAVNETRQGGETFASWAYLISLYGRVLIFKNALQEAEGQLERSKDMFVLWRADGGSCSSFQQALEACGVFHLATCYQLQWKLLKVEEIRREFKTVIDDYEARNNYTIEGAAEWFRWYWRSQAPTTGRLSRIRNHFRRRHGN
ncbi:hypothetical protein BJ508DRAFT_314726 [Ascobolus immersus RN42]|uniref:PNPLA domain-containing protein n=1 Tax=Ascobolus immersus RN42 TaxID=1160509 RepID=A0A3N4HDV5_ASCIM|nr:hypothetical protein BJ508DRAFT_314726 [Ascobolus immersus RN42]